MNAERIDVLAAIDEAAALMRGEWSCERASLALADSRAAVAELLAADRGYDAAKAHRIEADNRITSGDRSDDAFRLQATTHHAYDRAVDRRREALAKVQP